MVEVEEMMPSATDRVLVNLAALRENLSKLMNPEVLKVFANYLDATGNSDGSMLSRFKWFVENSENGADCKYAAMAKEFFLKDQATECAKAIIWLYKNWAKHYE